MFKFLKTKIKKRNTKQLSPTPYEELRGSILANEPLSMLSLDEADTDDETSLAHNFAAAQRLETSSPKAAIEHLRYITEHPVIETRSFLQAWHSLRALGVEPDEVVGTQVRGIVVEVGLKAGVDAVAAYRDHTARYFNYSGATVVWDTETAEMNATIDPLLEIATSIGESTAPIEDPHPPVPEAGVLLINILTPAGIHIGMGDMKAMQSDPMGAGVTQAALTLMQKLMKVGDSD